MGFNEINVLAFFDNLKRLFEVWEGFPPHIIWNLDETRISAVRKPQQILAEKRVKQVGQITSRERVLTVTLCAHVNALVQAVHPVFKFPRVHFKDRRLNKAPEQSLGLGNSSG